MKITIHDDFDLYKIAYSGQCFRVCQLGEDTFRFITGKHSVTIRQEGTSYDVSCSAREWDLIWHDYFDLDTDYRSIRAGIPDSDRFLKNASEIGKGIRILRQDKFEMLISFIISQRKSIPAIKKSVEEICLRYGKKIIEIAPEELGESKDSEISIFPSPARLSEASEADLAKCGLGYRVPYIVQAAKRVSSEEVNLESIDNLSDEELMEMLKSFYGVGDKVANCVALFSYHRTGLAPIDTWIKKVIESEYNGVNPFPCYGRYAGIMQQYMFYAAQHEKIL